MSHDSTSPEVPKSAQGLHYGNRFSETQRRFKAKVKNRKAVTASAEPVAKTAPAPASELKIPAVAREPDDLGLLVEDATEAWDRVVHAAGDLREAVSRIAQLPRDAAKLVVHTVEHFVAH